MPNAESCAVLRPLRARDLLANLTTAPGFAEAMFGDYMVFDHYGRILATSPAVARDLGLGDRGGLGRLLVHRVVGPTRAAFFTSMVRMRAKKRFEPITLAFRTRERTISSATLSVRVDGTVHGLRVAVMQFAWSEPQGTATTADVHARRPRQAPRTGVGGRAPGDRSPAGHGTPPSLETS